MAEEHHWNRRHGRSHSPEHNAWLNIRARCANPNNTCFHRYGALGIRVCERWETSFESFLEDMGERPSPRHSIERRNNSGNYEPQNCYWALPVDQANNRSTNKHISFNGETRTLAQWAKSAGLRVGTFHYRIKRGWPMHLALSKADGQRKFS